MIDEKKLIGFINSKEFQMRIVRSQKSVQEILCEFIEEQPKIGDWITCSERLPEEDGFYLVTLTEKVTDINDTRVTKVFFSEKSNSFTGYGKSVIAWQPLPEEYHG